jgi:uncharacterized membrane protein required for colicin V production
MSLDLWVLAALGAFAAIGYYTGAIQQLSHWIGMAAAYLCARPLSAALAPALAARMGWPLPLTAVGLSAVLMPVILICAALISRGILNALVPGDQRNTPDRIVGLVLGGGKAAAIVWVALSVVLAFEKPLAANYPEVKDALGASSAAALVRKHALFPEVSPSVQEKLRALGAMRGDPQMAQALLNDPALKQALEKGDVSALLENPQVKKLLSDPELAKKLEALKTR